MRNELIQRMKLDIHNTIKTFMREEKVELYIAANDNVPLNNPLFKLEEIDEILLSGSKLLFEMRVVMGVLGKPWQCEALIKGMYYALHSRSITLAELTVLLMSVHVEQIACVVSGITHKRAIMRYIVEEA